MVRPGLIPFDSKEWKNSKINGNQKIRQNMYRHLVSKYKLVGTTKGEIIKLLGFDQEAHWITGDYLLQWNMGSDLLFGDDVWFEVGIEGDEVAHWGTVSD